MPHPLSKALKDAVRDVLKDPTSTTYRRTLKAVADKVAAVLDPQDARIRNMQAAAVASGNTGRKRKPFDLAQAQVMKADGKSLQQIAEAIGVHRQTVYNRLKEAEQEKITK